MQGECCVVGCTSRSVKTSDSVTLHRFPPKHDNWARLAWIEATGQGLGWSPSQDSRICSVHFSLGCFKVTLSGRVFLRSGSVPTIFCQQSTRSASPIPEELGEEPEQGEVARLARRLRAADARVALLTKRNKSLEATVGVLEKKNKEMERNLQTLQRLNESLAKRSLYMEQKNEQLRQRIVAYGVKYAEPQKSSSETESDEECAPQEYENLADDVFEVKPFDNPLESTTLPICESDQPANDKVKPCSKKAKTESKKRKPANKMKKSVSELEQTATKMEKSFSELEQPVIKMEQPDSVEEQPTSQKEPTLKTYKRKRKIEPESSSETSTTTSQVTSWQMDPTLENEIDAHMISQENIQFCDPLATNIKVEDIKMEPYDVETSTQCANQT